MVKRGAWHEGRLSVCMYSTNQACNNECHGNQIRTAVVVLRILLTLPTYRPTELPS